ncbi:Protein of unknown function [Shimia gijangensis]|uniref:Inner membrane protein YgaP-like transmembrane domain-containing protein n=1 Tax=Shimia gijangensis TaxID=1470563 RepID=A0A1M6EM93_9RHOB|nr:DUF2892 domain-containing protein [Shimia gijangensis]SHI86627.1 Protein of unknown function [Shimia gijangensis]
MASKIFAKNVGSFDRILRIGAGATLTLGFFVNYNPLFLIGVPIALTGIFSTCWLYSLLGLSTAKA